jgi:hypothetical protein
VLAGDCQWLPVFLSVVEQVSLIILERSAGDLGRDCNSISSAPSQEHLHVNVADPKSAFGESLHCKVLEIPFHKFSERCIVLPGQILVCSNNRAAPDSFDLKSDVFFILPPDHAYCHSEYEMGLSKNTRIYPEVVGGLQSTERDRI